MGQISQNEILCFFISHTKADLGCFLNENFWSLRACKKAANELHNIFLSHIYFFCRNFHHFNVFVLKSEYKLFWRVDDLTDLFFGLEVSKKKKLRMDQHWESIKASIFFNTVKICLDVDLMLSIIYQQFNFLSIPNIDWVSSQFWFVSTVETPWTNVFEQYTYMK